MPHSATAGPARRCRRRADRASPRPAGRVKRAVTPEQRDDEQPEPDEVGEQPEHPGLHHQVQPEAVDRRAVEVVQVEPARESAGRAPSSGRAARPRCRRTDRRRTRAPGGGPAAGRPAGRRAAGSPAPGPYPPRRTPRLVANSSQSSVPLGVSTAPKTPCRRRGKLVEIAGPDQQVAGEEHDDHGRGDDARTRPPARRRNQITAAAASVGEHRLTGLRRGRDPARRRRVPTHHARCACTLRQPGHARRSGRSAPGRARGRGGSGGRADRARGRCRRTPVDPAQPRVGGPADDHLDDAATTRSSPTTDADDPQHPADLRPGRVQARARRRRRSRRAGRRTAPAPISTGPDVPSRPASDHDHGEHRRGRRRPGCVNSRHRRSTVIFAALSADQRQQQPVLEVLRPVGQLAHEPAVRRRRSGCRAAPAPRTRRAPRRAARPSAASRADGQVPVTRPRISDQRSPRPGRRTAPPSRRGLASGVGMCADLSPDRRARRDHQSHGPHRGHPVLTVRRRGRQARPASGARYPLPRGRVEQRPPSAAHRHDDLQRVRGEPARPPAGGGAGRPRRRGDGARPARRRAARGTR